MRHLILSVGLLFIAAHAWAENPPAPAAESTTPPLTTTVRIDPNDSPMVRAAKKAVASRVAPSQRRVVSLTSVNTRGRVAFATGPVQAPNVPPPQQTNANVAGSQERQRASMQEVARIKAAEEKDRQDKLKQLEQEQQMLGAEMDEPYGGDIEEDAVEKRMYEIEAARQKAQQTNPPPPPPTR